MKNFVTIFENEKNFENLIKVVPRVVKVVTKLWKMPKMK